MSTNQAKPRMAPQISMAALPTPTHEWAQDVSGVLASHRTRTPGTPPVPGSFPYVSESERSPSPPTRSADGTQQASILETLPGQALAAARAYLPPGVAAYLPTSSDPESPSLPPLPQSTGSLTADSRQDSILVHTGHTTSTDGSSATADDSRPKPTPGLIPSFPGAGESRFVESPQGSVNSIPRLPADSLPVRPQLPTDVESGYAASMSSAASGPPPSLDSFSTLSSETPPTPTGPISSFPGAPVAIQGSASLNSSRPQDIYPIGDHHDVDEAGSAFTVQGSAALNSSRLQDNLPVESPKANAGLGAAALNSSRPQDNFPTGDFPTTPSSGLQSDVEDNVPVSAVEGLGNEESEEQVYTIQGGDAADVGRKRTKSGLMQKLKDKMHSNGSA
ncbi:unnamed protein product [Mycena citricolor]|uniref:Uncharacterized protein n=1 Tax=Mycena citricolor TaxID=2018698 RepID=A0AAD2K6T4_9AGAR|nr:unnamed protein product [Mycena citricolor]CAK5282024.1 unnamed protein product [Mycena citricolor]CAK5282063.1 unnamed protein product [Mycena citricolor]